MSLVGGYILYLAATTIYAVVVAQMACRRAALAGTTHYQVCLLVAWFDFWIGAYYDRKLHRVFMFPVPMFGIVVDFDAPAKEEG